MPDLGAGEKCDAACRHDVRSDADIYIHLGGQYECDLAALVVGAAVFRLHCRRIDRFPIVYNCRDVYMPRLLICLVRCGTS